MSSPTENRFLWAVPLANSTQAHTNKSEVEVRLDSVQKQQQDQMDQELSLKVKQSLRLFLRQSSQEMDEESIGDQDVDLQFLSDDSADSEDLRLAESKY